MTGNYAGDEKRKHARYHWTTSVVLLKDDTSSAGEIQNISMGGILVKSSLPLKYGDEVTAEFMVPKLDKKIKAKCAVRWMMGEETIGLSFVGLKAIETWAVSQLVRQLANEQG
ncbi:MAG: PilZ domain-containing protein [Deltaproteobacteria bacterium]|nr:PilZ domain-containing protein [Deltaproteobacteria bacterium]MBN2670606.1 PilZ domain-containing protein [Deltaproteobacteria bacterium]